MVSDRDRRDLQVALPDRLGRGPADTLMQMLPLGGWADVARASDLEALRIERCREMAELGTELGGEMAQLGGDMTGLRGDLKVELASFRNQLFAANVATAAAVAGLVLAAARLA